MRARVAYISSFGTTTILVGSALLMLAVGSAIVAFRGWPAISSQAGVESVPLAPTGRAQRVAPLAPLAPRAPARAGLTRAPHARAARRISTAGLVKRAPARAAVVPGLVMVPATTTLSLASPPGARFPAPTRPPVQTPAPRRPPSVGPDGGPVLPVSVPGPGPPSPPGDAGQITAVAGSLVGAAPPPPASPAAAPPPLAPALGLDAAAAAASVLDSLR
jgi:hypothetical protein